MGDVNEMILPGERPLFDLDREYDEQRRQAAGQLEVTAVLAEIYAREWEVTGELMPERPDVAEQVAVARAAAAAARGRADRVRASIGGGEPHDLIERRVVVAYHLVGAQRTQVMLDERFAHPDLWAVTPDEARTLPDDPRRPLLTEEQNRVAALQGRAKVKAFREWLEEHPEGPDLTAAPASPMLPGGVEAAREFYQQHPPEAPPAPPAVTPAGG